MNTTENIITIEDLYFEYSNEEKETVFQVINGINMNIKRGEFLAVLGHNGSGKSTLAKHLNAILLPTSGRVTIDGICTADEDKLFDIRKKVGMVFQNPDNQMVANIVEEDVAFAPENLGVPREEIRRRVDSALDAVNMKRFAAYAPHMLSGGQKQRIAIAGVLAMEPEILVLDEPTAMLDPIGRQDVIDTVRRLNKEKGMTVVLITHYMEEAVFADRVIVVDSGKIEMEGTPMEIFPQIDRLKGLGLDTPQSTELLYRLRKCGFDIKGEALDVDECVEKIMEFVKQ